MTEHDEQIRKVTERLRNILQIPANDAISQSYESISWLLRELKRVTAERDELEARLDKKKPVIQPEYKVGDRVLWKYKYAGFREIECKVLEVKLRNGKQRLKLMTIPDCSIHRDISASPNLRLAEPSEVKSND